MKKILLFCQLVSVGLFLIQCTLDNSNIDPDESDLKLIAEHDLFISEPSGLTLGKDNSTLWTVSDNTNRVYNITLNGQRLDELKYEGNDLEGIVYCPEDNTFWLAEEQLREIVRIDSKGNELNRKQIDLPGSGNSGFEGICQDSLNTIYLLNEKDPQLWAKLDAEFSVERQIEIFEMADLSGICYDNTRNKFWVVSDQSKMLFLWSPQQGIIKSFVLPFAKAEGVAVDTVLNRIYIVSDATEKLYIFEIPEL